MKTRNLGISMNQGDDFSLVITISGDAGPIDLTGYSFKGKMKTTTAADEAAVASFVFTILNQSTNKGQVLWALPNADTTAIATSVSDGEQPKRLTTPYVFDVKMKDTNQKVARIIQGIIAVSPQTTDDDEEVGP